MTVSEKSRTISIVRDSQLQYPESEDYFSPDVDFPEYPFGHVAKKPNRVYRAVRRCFASAGLDAENFGKPSWNPLRGYVSPGQKVFILCNFVQHNISRSPEIILAKCTHGSVVRAVIDYVILALEGNGSVWFGNGPLQSCNWAKVIEETGARKVKQFYALHSPAGVTVELVDLRQHIVERSPLGTLTTRFHGEDNAGCVPVDLAAESLLEELYRGVSEPKLRVLDYDPRRTQRCHAKGRHIYLMSKRVLECDVIISIPKLKTHEKVGITCGLKGSVGAVGHKDCLAHHRFGPPSEGGDEYPDSLRVLKPLSLLHDAVNTAPSGHWRDMLHMANQGFRILVRRFTRSLSGSWPGNDTCWRMALDLARILEYADKNGQLFAERQRTHLMVTDGIVGGEGNGPLSPQPVKFGYLSFSENIAEGDFVNCLAIGFDPQKLPIVRRAFGFRAYPLSADKVFNAEVLLNEAKSNLAMLAADFRRRFRFPREWRSCV
jgi:uncharacterized protein (DUF362 family)